MATLPHPAEGTFDDTRHRYAVSVYFEDTDAGGIVYHANYLRWFERARTDMLRLLGMDQRAALDAGEGFYAIAELAIRYRQPARLGDVVIVETTVISLGAASWRASHRALRDGELLAEAEARIGFVGSGGRAGRQPDAWRQSLQTILHAESTR